MSYVLQAGDTISSRWPSQGLQILNYLSLLLGQLVLAFVIGSRYRSILNVLLHPQVGRPSYWARLYLALVFIFSLLFVVLAGLLQFGIGASSINVCQAGILACILVYGLSKLCLYLFLNERAWIVHDTVVPKRRSWFYCLNLALISIGPVLVVLNCIGRVYRLDDDGSCHIGLSMHYSIPFITWDAAITVYLTALFVKPLLPRKHSPVNPHLRRLAIVSLVCALAALATSIANVSILVVLRTELTFICLSTCPLDIGLNALILAATTQDKDKFDSWAEGGELGAKRSTVPSSTMNEMTVEEANREVDLQSVLLEAQLAEASKGSRRPSVLSLGGRRISMVAEKSSQPTSPWEQLKLSPLEEAALNTPVEILSKEYEGPDKGG